MGAAASMAQDQGGALLAKLKEVAAPKSVEENKPADDDDDEDEDGPPLDDLEKVQKLYKKQGFANQRLKAENEALDTQNKELRIKLADMMTALKQLKSELNTTVTEKEAAEAHLSQMANPEREAYMNKYALEKLQEEFEQYKQDTAAEKAHLERDMRRLQENLANRAAGDDAAKAAMQAEIRELKSNRGLMQFFDGQMVPPKAAPEAQAPGQHGPKGKGGAGGGGADGARAGADAGRYPVADLEPHAGLKPRDAQVERAAGVVVDAGDGLRQDTRAEAEAKRKVGVIYIYIIYIYIYII